MGGIIHLEEGLLKSVLLVEEIKSQEIHMIILISETYLHYHDDLS
jgi:hypothetical protein